MISRAGSRTLIPALLVGLAFLSGPVPVAAQDVSGERGRIGLRAHARAGIALPAADMKDYVDEGPVLGAGLAYRVSDRFWVRGDWTAALMRAAHRQPLRNDGVNIPLRGSETDLHHLTGGLQVELSDPERADIEIRSHGGLGVTLLSSEETDLAVGGHFTQFTLDVGLELAVPLSQDLRFIGRGDLYLLPLQAGAPPHLKKELTLPFSGGLEVGL